MITRTPDKINKTVQEIKNLSFDKDFNVLAIELVAHDGTELKRVAVDSNGYLKVTI